MSREGRASVRPRSAQHKGLTSRPLKSGVYFRSGMLRRGLYRLRRFYSNNIYEKSHNKKYESRKKFVDKGGVVRILDAKRKKRNFQPSICFVSFFSFHISFSFRFPCNKRIAYKKLDMLLQIDEFSRQFSSVFAIYVEEHLILRHDFDAFCLRINDILIFDMRTAQP